MRSTIRLGAALLMTLSVLLMALERTTGRLSFRLGELFCGVDFLRPLKGALGDHSCGFNADMKVMAVLGGLFLLGVLLWMAGRER